MGSNNDDNIEESQEKALKDAPSPNDANSEAQARQALVSAIMRDTNLSPQERQQKIREVLSTPHSADHQALDFHSKSEEDPQLSPSIDIPHPPSSRQELMQEVMKDSTLSPRTKQYKIQDILSGENTAPSSPSKNPTPESTDRSKLKPPPPNSASIGAVASQGDDPAQSKSSRTMTKVSASVVATPTTLSEPNIVGNSANAGNTRGSCMSSETVEAVEPDEPNRNGVGVVAMSNARLPRKSRQSGNTPMSPVVGRSADPAFRKSRASVGTSQSNVSATTDDAAQKAAARASYMAQLEPSDRAAGDESEDQTPPSNVERTLQTSGAFAVSTRRVDVRPSLNVPVAAQDQQPPVLAPAQVETYAEVGLSNPAIVESNTGGVQAYVAGESDAPVIASTAVVTEAELEAADKKEQRRCFRIGMLLCCLVVIAVAIPVAIVVTKDDSELAPTETPTSFPTASPTAAPTSQTYVTLLNTLEELYDDDESFSAAFANSESAQSQAARWATQIAPLGLDGNDPRMISRYALAAFYFSTGGDDWYRCGANSNNCESEREWLTSDDECSWDSITCDDNGTVVDIFFQSSVAEGNNINGTLPSDIAFLSGLQRFVLSNEGLRGTVPQFWSRLSTLTTVLLGGNDLSGTFPDFLLAPNTLLGTVFMGENRISGSLPTLTSPSLNVLRLSDNLITGTLPQLDLPELVELYLDENILSGTISVGLYTLTSLQSLRLGENAHLSGTISESIGQLSALEQLRMAGTDVGGTIPSALFGLVQLNRIELSDGRFSGTLSEEFSKLTNITNIRLANNTFSGTFPSMAFVSLDSLKVLELHGNNITGVVSEALCNRTGDSFFDIGVLTVDCDEVQCECCDCY
eukprot:Nitzschia sp. Nitz4//scaffold3_size479765//352407//355277//NITZ4_000147-RA/size479765-augustus-gene-1.617-mRNA-1//-1//CDS//3329550899//4661//frame0